MCVGERKRKKECEKWVGAREFIVLFAQLP